jgi:hypothetical protein
MSGALHVTQPGSRFALLLLLLLLLQGKPSIKARPAVKLARLPERQQQDHTAFECTTT